MASKGSLTNRILPTPIGRYSAKLRGPQPSKFPARVTPAQRSGGMDPLYNPAAILSGQDLADAAASLAHLQTAGAENAARDTINQNNRQGAAVGQRTMGYYLQLAAAEQQALKAQQQNQAGLNTQLQGIGDQARQRITQSGWQGLAGLQGMADKDLGGGAQSQLVNELTAQQGVAANNSATAQSFGARQGASQVGLQASQIGTSAQRGKESLADLANHFALLNQKPEQDLQTAKQTASDLLVQNIGKLRDSEFQKLATEKTFGLKQDQLKVDAAKAAAQQAFQQSKALQDQANKDRQFQLDKAKYGDATAKDNYLKDHGLGPYRPGAVPKPKGQPAGTYPGGYKVAATQKAYAGIAQARSLIQDLTQKGLNSHAIRSALANGFWYDDKGKRIPVPRVNDPDYVNAAFDILSTRYGGAIGKVNEDRLHAKGVRIHPRFQTLGKGGSGPAVGAAGSGFKGF